MAFPEQWEVNSGKWVASVFALFCSSNPVAVDYHSAGGQWGLFGIDLGFGAVLGIDLGLGLVLEIDSKKNIAHFSQPVASSSLPTPHCTGKPSIIESLPFFCWLCSLFLLPIK